MNGMKSLNRKRKHENGFHSVLYSTKEKPTDMVSFRSLHVHMERNTGTEIIRGSVTEDSRKSLSPVRNKSA